MLHLLLQAVIIVTNTVVTITELVTFFELKTMFQNESWQKQLNNNYTEDLWNESIEILNQNKLLLKLN